MRRGFPFLTWWLNHEDIRPVPIPLSSPLVGYWWWHTVPLNDQRNKGSYYPIFSSIQSWVMGFLCFLSGRVWQVITKSLLVSQRTYFVYCGTFWFWYAVTPINWVSGNMWVLKLSLSPCCIVNAFSSLAFTTCILGWYLCIEFKMTWREGKKDNLLQALHIGFLLVLS